MVDLTATIVSRIKEQFDQARIQLQGPESGERLGLDTDNNPVVVSTTDSIDVHADVEDQRIDATISHPDLIQLNAYRLEMDPKSMFQGYEMASRWQAADEAARPEHDPSPDHSPGLGQS